MGKDVRQIVADVAECEEIERYVTLQKKTPRSVWRRVNIVYHLGEEIRILKRQ